MDGTRKNPSASDSDDALSEITSGISSMEIINARIGSEVKLVYLPRSEMISLGHFLNAGKYDFNTL